MSINDAKWTVASDVFASSITSSHVQILGFGFWDQEREYHPTSILHPKKWFLTSHSYNHVPPEVDFKSSKSPAKSESWNSPSLHCFAVLPTWQYCLYAHVWWMKEIIRDKCLSQALVHFVIDRASLFTDHTISGRPIRAKYKHSRTIWEHICDNSPTDFISSSLKWWSSMHGVDTL